MPFIDRVAFRIPTLKLFISGCNELVLELFL